MTTKQSGRDLIDAAFDEIDYLRDLLFGATHSLKKVLRELDTSHPDYDTIEIQYQLLDTAYIAVDELATYLS